MIVLASTKGGSIWGYRVSIIQKPILYANDMMTSVPGRQTEIIIEYNSD